jgi:outer membrane protein assembly factor BamB
MSFVRRRYAALFAARRPNAVLFAVLVAALIAALVSAGCGGSGPTTSGSGATTSASGASTSTSGPATSGSASTTSTTGSAGAGGSSTSTSQSPSGGQPSVDWPTYHHDAARNGVAADQGALGTVTQAWTSAALDGAIYAQPLVVGDRVFVASEGNTVYALDAAGGGIAWQQNLGEPVPGGDLPCGNIDPSGISGTPVIDVGGGVLYVVANLRSGPHHELFALGLSDGAVRWHRAIDPPGLQPAPEQQRGALALSNGKVYVPFGGLYGDCGPYKGAVVSVAADGSGDIAAYVVPTRRMAGIWNPAGPAIDASGDLWVTTGNSAGQSTFDFGNAVIRLDAQLNLADYFAPSNWAQLNAGDTDLGSLGPVLLPNGRVLAMGKEGIAYLADAGNLGHVGDPITSLQVGAGAFGAAATSGTTVFVPTAEALVAISVNGDQLAVLWRSSGGSGPPIIARGVVWALGYNGKLRALDPSSGNILFSAQLGHPVSRFISPAAAGGRVFVADGDTLIAFTLR